MVYKFPDDHRIDDCYDCRFGGGKDAAVYAPEDDQGDKQCPERFFKDFGDFSEPLEVLIQCEVFAFSVIIIYLA